MGGRNDDIGQLVLEIADACLKGPKVNTVKEYFTLLEKSVKNIGDLPKFKESCEELKENIRGYNGAIYGQGCLKILTGAGLAAVGTYAGVKLSINGAAMLGFPLLVLSYFALVEPFRGISKKIKEKDKCVEAPALTWLWAINSYKKDIQERIQKFYGTT